MGSSLFGLQAYTAQELAYIALDFLSKNFFNIIGSAIILFAAWLIAKLLGKLFHYILMRNKADITIAKFLVDMLRFAIIAVSILIVLGKFGITIAPLVAGLGAVGFGASFALQGPLSNYAAGATLIFTKPFKVGDIVEVGNNVGKIEDITLARTIMRALDGTIVVIPNKKIVGEIMHIYSSFKALEVKVGIAYSSDVEQAIRLVKEAVAADKRVADNPVPKVGICEFADSGIIVYARLWCAQEDYWDLMFDINKAILGLFNKHAITIPFPQREVRIINKER